MFILIGIALIYMGAFVTGFYVGELVTLQQLAKERAASRTKTSDLYPPREPHD